MTVIVMGQVQRVVQAAMDDLADGIQEGVPQAHPLEGVSGAATSCVEWGGRQVMCRVAIDLENILTPDELPAGE